MTDFYTSVFTHKGKALVRAIVNGKREQYSEKLKPFLFIANKGSKTDDGFTTLRGEKVARMDFDSTYEAREFLKKYEDVGSFNVYGTTNWSTQFIKDRWPEEIDHDFSMVNVVGTDIEVDADETTGFPDINTANLPITTCTFSRAGKYIALGTKVWRPEDPDVQYILCRDEKHLLQRIIEVWKILDPDVLTGWNIDFFDIPYLVNRIRRILGEESALALSPWGILEEKTVEFNGRENVTFFPAGIAVLDYLRLYKKFSFGNQESYKLDHIAKIELDEQKVDYSEYGSLKRLYEGEPLIQDNPEKNTIHHRAKVRDLIAKRLKKTSL